MATPTNLKGESLSKLLQGSAIGAVVAVTLGFSVGGWTLGSSAEKQAMDHAKSALVSTLAPICVDSFQSSPNLAKNLEELIKQST